MSIAYLGLGSNVGDRVRCLRDALDLLQTIGDVVRQSSIYETEPVGFTHQPLFLNMAVALETRLDPEILLSYTQTIEHMLGRERTLPNGPRTIDIDILLYGDAVVSSETLIIPHARLHERAFMLVPLAEIASWAIHPVLKKSIAELLDGISDRGGVSLYDTKNS